MMAVVTQAQNITVHGTVLSSADDEPLIGASVVADGNGLTGVTTDLDGNFTITIPDGSSLIISYVGYKPKTVKAESQMTILLDED